ncbi:MAG TPA: hypothetical protein VFX84_03130 [Candidatus Saccharimonadales bacterium]|nr:hypothetical protein [Candidatus Saccharimonadales bacterium]
MSEIPDPVMATPDKLEETFESAKVVNGAAPNGDILNAFMGTEDLISMGGHLLKHMRDEERWGGPNESFKPMDFVIAAHEVARDQTAGEAIETQVRPERRQPLKLSFNMFIGFWLPRVAEVAYGSEYAAQVRSIIDEVQ